MSIAPTEKDSRPLPALRVVKVGGSLFDYEGLAPALRQWLDLEPPLPTVLLAGGGKLVDAIREADARFQLGEEASHWLCVSAMSVTARLLATLLPEAMLGEGVGPEGVGSLTPLAPVSRRAGKGLGERGVSREPLTPALSPEDQGEGVERASTEKDSRPLWVFDPEPFLRNEEHLLPSPLPHTWHVTSDSISARLAEVLEAQELVLLKSAAGESYPTREAAAAAGYVDQHFPIAAARIPRVRWVNLHSADDRASRVQHVLP